MARKLSLILLLSVVVAVAGCDLGGPPTLPPTTEGGGFLLETFYTPSPEILPVPAGGVTVKGEWQSEPPSTYVPIPAGDPSTWTVTTDSIAVYALSNARAPATWKFTWISGMSPNCAIGPGNNYTNFVALHSLEAYICYDYSGYPHVNGGPSSFSFNPSPIFTYSPPPTATITGSGFDPTYGMPRAQYYSMNGTLVAQELASSVSGDLTTITLAGGDISALGPGTYAGFLQNPKSDGTFTYLGTAAVDVNGPIDVGTTCPPPDCGALTKCLFANDDFAHPYATVTSAYLTSGNSAIWRAGVSQQYWPYPYLVPAACIRFIPGQSLGTFQAMEHIGLSDGAQFDRMFTGTNAPY